MLKIDRVFVRALSTKLRDRKLVRAMICLAHDLGYRVVAEGVESAACAALLRAWHCDEAQGYHFAKPLPAEQLLTWLSAAEHRPNEKGLLRSDADPFIISK